jgi:mRNA-degrading endonuclease RelE of RelBE toxin-antitoxin system
LTDVPLIEIRLTPEFQRKLKNLAKKYRQVPTDLQPVLEQLQLGEFLGDQIPGIGSTVMKVRIRNSDTQKGKSGGYRLIYWLFSAESVVLIDIYSKSEQEDIEVDTIHQIIKRFNTASEKQDDF